MPHGLKHFRAVQISRGDAVKAECDPSIASSPKGMNLSSRRWNLRLLKLFPFGEQVNRQQIRLRHGLTWVSLTGFRPFRGLSNDPLTTYILVQFRSWDAVEPKDAG